MKFLCKLGFHKWEIFESKDRRQIEDIIENELRGLPGMSYRTAGFIGKVYEKKVCLNCEKFIDTLNPQYKKIKPTIIHKLKIIEKYGEE